MEALSTAERIAEVWRHRLTSACCSNGLTAVVIVRKDIFVGILSFLQWISQQTGTSYIRRQQLLLDSCAKTWGITTNAVCLVILFGELHLHYFVLRLLISNHIQ